MKRRLLINFAAALVLLLFASFNRSFHLRAQGGEAKLSSEKKTAPNTTTPPRGNNKSAKVVEPAKPVVTGPIKLSFNQEAKSQLDPRATEKFIDFLFEAKNTDLLTINSDNPALTIQLFDKENSAVALTKGATAGELRLNTSTGGLPADGEYRLRVTAPVSSKNAAPFTIKINRLGLTSNVYSERLQKIVLDFRANNPASVDETLLKLEELTKDDNNRAGAFEFLGIIYLHNRQDTAKAEAAMTQALKLNGAAIIKISFDHQWRRLVKLRSGKPGWEDARTGWLQLRPNHLEISDSGHQALATLKAAQIKEMAKMAVDDHHAITITTDNTARPFIFAPSNMQPAAADLIVKLVQIYVMGKTN
jgi:hypothetical protein